MTRRISLTPDNLVMSASLPVHVYLAAGASGSEASMAPWISGLREIGAEASYVALPRGRAEPAMAAYGAAVDDPLHAIIGGRSFGGRVASLLAADTAVAGLVLISYPLHPPGHPELVAERTAHWSRLRCPVLFLSGESDPFARIELLRAAVHQLPRATLVTYPRLGHGLDRVRADALRHIEAFVATVASNPA